MPVIERDDKRLDELPAPKIGDSVKLDDGRTRTVVAVNLEDYCQVCVAYGDVPRIPAGGDHSLATGHVTMRTWKAWVLSGLQWPFGEPKEVLRA